MHSIRATLVAAALLLAAAAPGGAQDIDRPAQATYYYGCNAERVCASATFFMQYVEGDPVNADYWIDTYIHWYGVGGALTGDAALRTVPHTMGLWDPISIAPSLDLCTYPTSHLRSACAIRWFTTMGQRVPRDFAPTDMFIEIGIGADSELRPLSSGVVHLTAVPEPATVALLGGGLLALGSIGAVRRRRQG